MRLPLLVLLLTTPVLAADSPAQPNPEAKPLDHAIRQLTEKLTRPKSSSPIRGMTLPSPHYLQHYPTYFPPDQPSKLPSVPLKEAALEPVAQPSKPTAAAKDDANPLLGTWVREVPGMRVTLKFTEKRLFVALQTASKPEGKGPVETGTIKLDADYGVGPGGRVFGVVTGVDFTVSDWSLFGTVRNAEAVENVLDELPFSFRARAEDDTLTVAGLKAQYAGEINGLIVRLLGKFRRGDGTPLPPIKPVKAESPFSGLGSSTAGDRSGLLGVGEFLGAVTGSSKAGSLHCEEAPSPREVSVPMQMVCAMDQKLQSVPDRTRNGEKTTVLVGKLYLFGADNKAIDADGEFVVVMHDTTTRREGQDPKIGQHLRFDAQALKKCMVNDERFGQHYAFPIPWPKEWVDVTHVTISAKYSPDQERNKTACDLHYPEMRFKVGRE